MPSKAVGIRSATVLALGLLVGVGGCSDASGPEVYYDPTLTLEQLRGVLYPFENGGDLLLGLDLAVITLERHGSAGLADLASLRPDRHRDALRSRRTFLRRERTRRPAEVGMRPDEIPSPFTVPIDLLGRTLVWDPYDGYVVSGLGGGPSDGVRLVLYEMDGDTGYPATPMVERGYIDFVDEDSGLTEGVRVRAVRTTGPTEVLADYEVRLGGAGSYEEGNMTITATGRFGETGSVELDLSQRFEWSLDRDRDELYLDYTFGQELDTVRMEARATSRYEALEWATFDFDLYFLGYGPAVRLIAEIGASGSLSGVIRQEGQEMVRIRGSDGNPRFESARGNRLHWQDEEVLRDVWTGIGDLVWYTDWMLVPADLLVSSG